MFSGKNKPATLTRDAQDELIAQKYFDAYETACREQKFQLAFRHLISVAYDDHFGRGIRGKALYLIYKMAKDNLIDLRYQSDQNKQMLGNLLTLVYGDKPIPKGVEPLLVAARKLGYDDEPHNTKGKGPQRK